MAYTVGMVSLGCAKNQVDGEVLMASLKNAGFTTVDDAALADIAIVNTCGFIESAKRESIEEILELAALKKEGKIKKLVITGCLSERYQKEMHQELPEADAVLGIGANGDIAPLLTKMMEENTYVESFPDKARMPLCGDRELTTPSYFAYVKIAEGCDNRCSYCAIPDIRGRFRSRPMESLLAEAETLAAKGVKELVVVAQDPTRYGKDLYGKYKLAELLRNLAKIDGFRWIRVLYAYPERITEELLDVIASERKVVKYLDLPIQHCNRDILRAMRRPGDRESLEKLIAHLRERVPGITLRTTLIAGFPGETEAQFEELCDFVQKMRFDRLGCFAYSQEEGTPAAEMDGQLDDETKAERARIINEEQMGIMAEKNEEAVDKELLCVVEGYDRWGECFFGRGEADAPDIDGKVFFTAKNKLAIGQFVRVKVEDTMDLDLIGVVTDEHPE